MAGAMGLDALISAMKPLAAKSGICPENATFQQVKTTISQYADLVLDAPQFQDTTRGCDAISIGIGIRVAPAAAPTEVVPAVSPPTPGDCTPPDAGPGDAQADADTADAG